MSEEDKGRDASTSEAVVRLKAKLDFAAKRSHQDAQVSNESARAAAQSVILINGGAATAILAYLSKDKLDADLLPLAAISLAIYVLGVFFGAVMMHATIRSLDFYNVRWGKEVMGELEDPAGKWAAGRALKWFWANLISFWLSVTAFLVGSGLIAYALLKAKPTATAPILLNALSALN